MLSREKLEQLMGILGDITDEQKAMVAETLNGPINEKELFDKLSVDEGKFMVFLKALAAEREDVVLGQELSADEMEAATGGITISSSGDECTGSIFRNIYEGGFPNCAGTVEDRSWCGMNDACHHKAVIYKDMQTCTRSWK